MSAPSYLLSRVELMVKAPPVPSSLMGTFLICGGSALDLLLLSVELSGMSSTVAQHSEEVHLPEWVRGVSPVFFSLGAPSTGAGALAAAAATASVKLAGANQRIFLVGGDGDDVHRPGHLQHVVGVV